MIKEEEKMLESGNKDKDRSQNHMGSWHEISLPGSEQGETLAPGSEVLTPQGTRDARVGPEKLHSPPLYPSVGEVLLDHINSKIFILSPAEGSR